MNISWTFGRQSSLHAKKEASDMFLYLTAPSYTRKMQSVHTEGRCSLVGAIVWRLEVHMTALHDYQIG
jgi:hypothetical protein